MDIIQSTIGFLENKRTAYEFDKENGAVFIKFTFGEYVAALKIFEKESNLVFSTSFAFKINIKMAREIIVAVNKVNSRIKFGKFVFSGGFVRYITVIPVGDKFNDKEVAFMLSASRSAANDYYQTFLDIGSGKLPLKDFLESV